MQVYTEVFSKDTLLFDYCPVISTYKKDIFEVQRSWIYMQITAETAMNMQSVGRKLRTGSRNTKPTCTNFKAALLQVLLAFAGFLSELNKHMMSRFDIFNFCIERRAEMVVLSLYLRILTWPLLIRTAFTLSIA